MDFKNLSRWEVVAIICCIIVFVFLSFIVVFKSEWLDSVIYGPVSERQEAVMEPTLDYEEETAQEEYIEEEPYATLYIASEEGRAPVSLHLEKEGSLTGFELVLEKDPLLNIEEFVCEEPFECLFFDVTNSEVSVIAVVPPASVDINLQGELVMGEFIYSGTGSLFLESDSTTLVSTIENPEFNILKIERTEFLLE